MPGPDEQAAAQKAFMERPETIEWAKRMLENSPEYPNPFRDWQRQTNPVEDNTDV